MSEAKGHSYLQSHEISGNVLTLDVEAEVAGILEAAKAAGVGHAARTLVKDGPLRIIILGLKAGATLQEHESAGPVSIHLLSGQVRAESPGRSDSLRNGQVLVFDAAVSHSLAAQADSVVLLTIAWPTT
jgi:quercetin dioxygenase-like cupin family protein